MEPKEYFKKPILGQLTTRIIDHLSLEGIPSSIDSEKTYDVIDVVPCEGSRMFVTNTWDNEEEKIVLAVHNNFVKETNLDERSRNDRFSEQGFRLVGDKTLSSHPKLSEGSGLQS